MKVTIDAKNMDNEPIAICVICDSVIEPTLFHNCIQGLTNNINRLRQEMFEFQRKIIKMVAK